MKWAAYGGFWRREFAANQGAGAVVATSFFRSTCQLKGGYLHVELNDGKDADHLLSFPHGVDIPVRRVASGFRVVGFLNHTKTFHDVFVVFTTPTMAPITTFLVEYGHLLIGLSLLTGFMVRVSASFGVMLMIIYWFAHMDWPFIENKSNLIVDFHLVYAGVLTYLVVKRAGHVFGLDGWAENLEFFKQHPALKPLVA